jgi:CheY-like chemotaxis protein
MIQVVSTRPRVLVAEDHAEMRERIANLLASTFDVVAAVVDGQQAVEATAATSEGTLSSSMRTMW